MKCLKLNLAAAVLASFAIGAASAAAQSAPELSLTRLDCGKTTTLADVSRFSDVAAFKGLSIQLTFSCYLIKHGNDYLVWDTGNPPATGSTPAPTAPSSSLVEQLAQLHLKPEQINFVGISHYHGDHVGPSSLLSAGDVADRQGRLGRVELTRSPTPASIPRISHIGSAAAARWSRSSATRMCSATAASSC